MKRTNEAMNRIMFALMMLCGVMTAQGQTKVGQGQKKAGQRQEVYFSYELIKADGGDDFGSIVVKGFKGD